MIEKKHIKFSGRLLIVGFGSVGQGTLPLLLRHIEMPRERIRIVTGDTRGIEEAKHFSIKFTVKPLTRENYRSVLDPFVSKGDFLLNLSVEVSSVALIEYCHKRGVMYLDTCIEPLARRLHRHPRIGIAPLQLWSARRGAQAAHPALQRRADGNPDARRQSRAYFALGQTGAGQSRARHQEARGQA
jgi:saccharopine dehydrogenase-like NADP-dependent oxidoreductase